MDFMTLEVFLRAMHESQDISIFDVTDCNVSSLEDMTIGIATWFQAIYTGKLRDIEYKKSKDFDKYRVTDFFSTPHDSITIKVVRIPNLVMDYNPKTGFEVVSR